MLDEPRYMWNVPRTRNGGNTSRLGPKKVLIFKNEETVYSKPWEAHMYILSLDKNAFALGETPKIAYNNLKNFLLTRPELLPELMPQWYMKLQTK